MSTAPQSKAKPISPYSSTDPSVRAELSEIDASIRSSALFFIISAVSWLVLGSVFALIAALKSHQPAFLSECAWFTFGRVHPTHLNLMVFGWGSNVIFAVGLWIMARLCRAPIPHNGLLLIAGLFWNLGLTVGVIGILAGDLTSVEWLELPGYASPLLILSYLLIGVWGVMAFCQRRGDHVYVSQWYILGALFWFPWIYVIAQTMVIWFPVRGVVQSIVTYWFAHNIYALWLTPMALGTAYYLIPKVLGRPIYSYYLALLGFWSLALFSSWVGMQHLIGGPVPVWTTSIGIVASVMMVIPVIVVAINHHFTVVGFHQEVWRSPTLRFVVFGAVTYTVVTVIGSITAIRSVSEIVHFTHFTFGQSQLGIYGFFSMIMFGGVYYMMPRLLKREWPSALLIRMHFWGSALGIIIIVVALYVGGWIQGTQMNQAETAFIDIVRSTLPWLQARSVGELFLLVAHVAFAVNLFWMLFAAGAIRAKQGPTLLDPTNEEGVV